MYKRPLCMILSSKDTNGARENDMRTRLVEAGLSTQVLLGFVSTDCRDEQTREVCISTRNMPKWILRLHTKEAQIGKLAKRLLRGPDFYISFKENVGERMSKFCGKLLSSPEITLLLFAIEEFIHKFCHLCTETISIHGDMHLDNLMVCSDKEGFCIKIIDFEYVSDMCVHLKLEKGLFPDFVVLALLSVETGTS